MRLSIIVPVYNMAGGGKLDFCLKSLVNQTISDYEILAVDDASTDNSREILQEYAKQYPDKVKVLCHAVNKRQGGAKNTGLGVATGEWISFIDSDDWVTPDFYEKLLGKARETGADLVGCDYSLVEEHTMKPGRIVQNNTREQTGVLDRQKHGKLILRSGSMVIKIYRADVIRKNGLTFPEGIFYEDNCAGPVWSLYFRQFEKLDEPLYFYYQHQVSTVHYVSEAKCRDRMRAGELLLEEMSHRGFLEEYRSEIEYRFCELYFVNTLFSYMLGAKRKRLAFVRQLKEGMLAAFPGFEQNLYYQQYTGEEEKRMITMLMQSEVKFFWYYRALWWYRNLRKKVQRHA